MKSALFSFCAYNHDSREVQSKKILPAEGENENIPNTDINADLNLGSRLNFFLHDLKQCVNPIMQAIKNLIGKFLPHSAKESI